MEHKKSKWLQEVENDAVRITSKRFRDQQEEREYQKARLKTEEPVLVGATPARLPLEKKGE